MKKWIWVSTGIIVVITLVIISLFYYNESTVSKKNIEDRDNVEEAATFGNYTIFIEYTDDEDKILKIYDASTEVEKKVEDIVGNLYGIKWSKDGKFFLVDEGTSSIKKTYIIPIDNLEEKDSIVNAGDVIFSPDSSKLLIGVENNNKRAVETELNGNIDLAIYYIKGKTLEPLLKADEYTDYFPEYWDEDNNIGYLKYYDGKEESLILKYEPSNEELVMNIIFSKDNKNSLRKAIGLLPNLDFNRLEKLYGEGSVLSLLEWLSKQDIEEEDIVNLIKLMDDFVGEEYFLFIESIGNTYMKDKIRFIKALSKIPEKTGEVAYALHDLNIYDREGQSIFDDLELITNSEDLTNKEKRVGIDLINYYAACDT